RLAGAEMRHGQAPRPPGGDRGERVVPGLHVDIRWWSGRNRQSAGDAHSPDVADERGALAQVGDVMGGVAGGVSDLEALVKQALTAAQLMHIGLRNREHL